MSLKTGNPPTPRPIGRINWTGFLGLLYREGLREWKWAGMTIAAPALQSALLAAVFTLAGAGGMQAGAISFLQFLGAGLVMSAIMQRAFEVTAYSLMFDKLESGGLQDMLGAPLHPLEILCGYQIMALIVSGVVGLSVYMVMLLLGLGLPVHPHAALGFVVLATSAFSLTGLIAAILSAKWDSLSGKETFMVMPLVFLSGTFFPLSAVPEGAWRTAFQFNPIYHLVDGFRWAVTGHGDGSPALAALIGLAMCLILLGIAGRMISIGYRLKP